MGRLRGSVVVQTLCLWRRQLPAILTGSRWMVSLYTFEGVRPSIRTSEQIIDAAQRRPQPLLIGTTTAKDTKQPHFRHHDNTNRSPGQDCYSQSRKHGAGLQLRMGAWKCSRPTGCDSTFRPIQAYVACGIRPRGAGASKEQESTCRNIASPIQRPRPNRDSLRDRQSHVFIDSDWPASGTLAPSRCENP